MKMGEGGSHRARWLSSKMGYSRHGFWCPPREDSTDRDVSHRIPHTVVVNCFCFFPFPRCLSLLPLDGTRRAISCYGQR